MADTQGLRVLWLCKRQYTGRDMLDDRYGRLFEIPEGLARRGHRIDGVVLSYRELRPRSQKDLTSAAGVRWTTVETRIAPWSLPRRYGEAIAKVIAHLRPEIVVGASDAPHAAMAAHYAKRLGVPLVLDLYDQFEAFGLTRLPGIRTLFRRALRASSEIVCVSEPLRRWVEARVPTANVAVVSNGVDPTKFHALPRIAARQALGLPLDGVLAGTAGSLMRNRDIATLYRAFESLATKVPRLQLVVAGPRDLPPPQHPRVLDLGTLPHERIPGLFSALDIGVVCNADSAFARYCHPQKMAEMQACGLPLIVAGPVDEAPEDASWIARYRPGDAAGLAEGILRMLRENRAGAPSRPPSWDDLSAQFEAVLRSAMTRR